MNKRILHIGLVSSACLVITLPALIIIDFTPLQIAWFACWLLSFGFLIDRKHSLFIRGFSFLLFSVTIGLLGVAYAKAVDTSWLWLVDYISQIMVLVGSGVGANFIAQHFFQKETKLNNC